ncbi:hypothetical protein B0A48_06963 [Cryoendolithus antarcticus]|uniref:Uncharacterized protein n=1 Tax=Cryoendolithus antarcticus TaxID=1507870 RepID=A0A1V8T9Y5_9PEZI|nr:hypothetical protein B0A48_06963 [Cryoendolithus antarcticus]
MQSLRAIARAAPRATSRITSSSIRTSIRPSWTSFSTPLRTQSPCLAAAFSTSRRTFDASSTELAAKLQSELQLESENAETTVGSNGNVEAFFNDTDWKLHETDGETVVKLSRNYEGELIEVRFSIAEFNTPYEDPESSDEALMDEEDELAEGQSGGANSKGAINQGKTGGGNFKVAPEDDVAPADRDELRSAEDEQSLLPANVNVLISHPSSPNKGALRINLMADSGEFRVENVTHFPSADLPKAQVASQPLDTETAYAGPPFMQLDEDLQALFEAYLNERGIDTALAIFIPEYIDVKEQQDVTPSTVTLTSTSTQTPDQAVTLDVRTTGIDISTSTGTVIATIFVKRDGMLTVRSAGTAFPNHVYSLMGSTISTRTVTSAVLTARAFDPKASQLSSLQKQASAFVGGVCTCLETPRTTTVTNTPVIPVRTPATTITSVTATNIATVTATIWTSVVVMAPPPTSALTRTETVFSTTIVTTTSTNTQQASPIPSTVPCGQTEKNTDGFTVRYTCGARRSARGDFQSTFSSPSLQAYRDQVRNGGYVFGVDYDYSSSLCTTWTYPCADAACNGQMDHYIVRPAAGFVVGDVADFLSPPTYE